MRPPLLSVRDLVITIDRGGLIVRPVDGVSFDVGEGEVVGIAGESGSGKTLTLRSLLGLLPQGGVMTGDVALRSEAGKVLRAPLAGQGVAMVFQEPFLALNPTMRVGSIIAEGVRHRDGCTRAAAKARVLELMGQVGLPDPERQARMWPHQLSGGLRQRVMIAVALSARPRVLLCDEPTTALDVSVQDQILGLLAQLRAETGMSIVFVTHDLAVLGELCDRVNVMYAGQIVESGPVVDVFSHPVHRYTEALLGSVPLLGRKVDRLAEVPGQPPEPGHVAIGCRFAPRCPSASPACSAPEITSVEVGDSHRGSCVHPPSVGVNR